ncbi:MAG: cobalamin-dependent protein, partial [Candidatus Omnitrophota bacterium]
AVKKGIVPSRLIHQAMIPAINKVGVLFDRKEYFLPQLIASAEAMKIAFDHLKHYYNKDELARKKKKVVLLATVKGDIHDIGKNIVSLMLRNHSFCVIDLGKDVSSQRIIREAKKYKSPIIGLSALMTTTMVNMKEVVDRAKKEGLRCKFIIGGAVVTKAYAQSLGAEYAADSVEAVRVLKKISS